MERIGICDGVIRVERHPYPVQPHPQLREISGSRVILVGTVD